MVRDFSWGDCSQFLGGDQDVSSATEVVALVDLIERNVVAGAFVHPAHADTVRGAPLKLVESHRPLTDRRVQRDGHHHQPKTQRTIPDSPGHRRKLYLTEGHLCKSPT